MLAAWGGGRKRGIYVLGEKQSVCATSYLYKASYKMSGVGGGVHTTTTAIAKYRVNIQFKTFI